MENGEPERRKDGGGDSGGDGWIRRGRGNCRRMKRPCSAGFIIYCEGRGSYTGVFRRGDTLRRDWGFTHAFPHLARGSFVAVSFLVEGPWTPPETGSPHVTQSIGDKHEDISRIYRHISSSDLRQAT